AGRPRTLRGRSRARPAARRSPFRAYADHRGGGPGGQAASIALPGGASYTAPPRMPTTFREAYERLLPLVEKPGRYLGNERGTIRKDPSTVRLRFALCFPEVYEIAQSHLGLQILYDVLNRRPEVAAERAYAPGPIWRRCCARAGSRWSRSR